MRRIKPIQKTRRYNRPAKLNGGIRSRLQREFGDLEIIEGLIPLRLQPMQCDVEGAVPKDPGNCVFARAAARQYGASKIIFWRKVAYVDIVGRDGVRHVERFYVPKDTFRLIERFDRGEPLDEGRAFHLLIPQHHERRDVMNRRKRKNARSPKGRIIAAALTSKGKLKRAELRLERDQASLEEARTSSPPHSAKVKLAAKRVTSAKVVVREAKDEFEARTKAADKVREIAPHLKNFQPRTFDLSVRSGMHNYSFAKRVTA